jgi:hypothetical protein
VEYFLSLDENYVEHERVYDDYQLNNLEFVVEKHARKDDQFDQEFG